MPTYTTNFNLAKPLINNATDQDLWGQELNTDLDSIDSLTKTTLNWTPSVKTSDFSITAPTLGSTTTGDAKTIFLCNATSGNISVTLPTPSEGFVFAVKKTDSSTNTVTIVGTIDGSSNYVISAQNDSVVLVSTSTNYMIISDVKAPPSVPDASTSTKGIVQLATQADMESASSSTLAPTPSVIKYHPGVVKAWVKFDSAGNILAAYNISSVVRASLGFFNVTLSPPLSSENYCIIATPFTSASQTSSLCVAAPVTTNGFSLIAVCFSNGINVGYDPAFSSVLVLGDV